MFKKNLTKGYSALIIGISLLVMAVIAGITYGYLHTKLTHSTDFLNIEIFLWVFIIFLDVIVSIGLYQYFKMNNRILAIICSILRLIYTLFLIIAVSELIKILFGGEVAILTSRFEDKWSLGLIIFGLHLVLLGVLVFDIKIENKIVSIILILAGFSYFLINTLYNFLPQFDLTTKVIEGFLVIPMTVGELGFAIWVLIRGRR